MRKARTELASNPLLRLGLAAIAGIIWLNYLLDLLDKNKLMTDELKTTQSQLIRLNNQVERNVWAERNLQSLTTKKEQEKHMWPGENLSLTQSMIQDWLYQTLSIAKAQHALIKAGDVENNEYPTSRSDLHDSKTMPNGVTTIPFRVEFDFSAGALMEVLTAITNSSRLLTIDALQVKQPRIEMKLLAYTNKPQISEKISISAKGEMPQ